MEGGSIDTGMHLSDISTKDSLLVLVLAMKTLNDLILLGQLILKVFDQTTPFGDSTLLYGRVDIHF